MRGLLFVCTSSLKASLKNGKPCFIPERGYEICAIGNKGKWSRNLTKYFVGFFNFGSLRNSAIVKASQSIKGSNVRSYN